MWQREYQKISWTWFYFKIPFPFNKAPVDWSIYMSDKGTLIIVIDTTRDYIYCEIIDKYKNDEGYLYSNNRENEFLYYQ